MNHFAQITPVGVFEQYGWMTREQQLAFDDLYAGTFTSQDNKAIAGRPPKIVRIDRGARFNERCERNRQHIRKTFDLNMRLAHERWELADHCHRVAKDASAARRFAAECYAMKSFVTGIIEGRGHELSEKELTALKREWEDMWDQAFGDLVYELLNLNQR